MNAPPVTASDALADATWFAAHPKRSYRHRGATGGVWIIWNCRGHFLRTFSAEAEVLHDSDAMLEKLWHDAAWPRGRNA